MALVQGNLIEATDATNIGCVLHISSVSGPASEHRGATGRMAAWPYQVDADR